ncbi:hypothetical protein GBAR_LOCUS8208, partial [Geodia barretti]
MNTYRGWKSDHLSSDGCQQGALSRPHPACHPYQLALRITV